MRAPANLFQEYLAPDESVVDAGPGALLDDSYRTEGSIGVTDRRVLFVSDDGGYVDVAQGCISSIRSRPRTTFTRRGRRYRLLVLGGALLAAAAFLAAVVLTASAVAATLTLLSVGGFLLAEYLRRNGADRVWAALADARARLPLDGGGPPLRDRVPVADGLDDDQFLTLGVGLLALATLIGPVAVTASLVVLPLALLTLGGVAVADYAYRRERALDGVGGSRRHEREVSIHLVGGGVVRLRVDSTERLDRALTREAGETAGELPASTPSQV